MKHAKSLEHHAKAGAALKSGDTRKAMHHLGHIMADCRKCLRDEAAGLDVTAKTHAAHEIAEGGHEARVMKPKSSLRDRLKGMKKTEY